MTQCSKNIKCDEEYGDNVALSKASAGKPVLLSRHDHSGDTITIQQANRSDLPAIIDIYNQNVTSKQVTADLMPVTVADRVDWFKMHDSNPQRPLYVIKNVTGDVMAWGSFADFKSRAAYQSSSEVSIYVSANFQRRRLATLLLEWMIEQAPALGIKTIVALILADNRPSLRFFERAQFERWGLLPNICDMGDFMADVVIVGKTVHSG